MSDRIFTRFTAFALLIAMGLTAVLMAAIPGEAQGWISRMKKPFLTLTAS